MSDIYLDSPPLTVEQQAVVDAPWDARILVTAGAGAGKTHTLVRRLDALMAREELEAQEILVLSFSRAAVRELRERIDRHARAARRVRAQTFDSWATALLMATYPDGEWTSKPFDDRIAAATEAIDRGSVEETEQGPPAHIIIDEVQDLVGERREMVEALLDKFSDCSGFTVVGDPAQSVYGFQVSDPGERSLEINRFFDWLRVSFGEDLVELSLSENFRAATDEARTALSLGADLQRLAAGDGAKAEAERIHQELRSRLLLTPDFGDLAEPFVRESLIHYPGTSAILCRTNGQALHISESLHRAGVPHRLQRSAQDRSVPAWLAKLLRSVGSSSLREERFLEMSPDLGLPPDTDPATLWQALRRAARGQRGALDIARLRRVIAEGRLPDELSAQPDAPLVVSTVHRAKGLEFDRVLVVEPAALSRPRPAQDSHKKSFDYDPVSDARLLYVAMTRPRDDLYRLAPPATRRFHKDKRIDRWYVGGQESYKRYGMELSGLDVCREQPPGTDGFEADPVQLQEYLLSEVLPGDELTLSLIHRLPMSEDQTPPYAIHHAGRPVGVVSEHFRRQLHRLLKIHPKWTVERWPVTIQGLRVDSLETVAGSTAAAARVGLGEHGVWVVPRMCGLGRFRWYEENEKEQDVEQ